MAGTAASRSFIVRFKPRLWFMPFTVAAALSACGGIATSDGANPVMSGQIFIETAAKPNFHPSGAASFATPAGVTVEHYRDGIFIESTLTDTFGRFRFQSMIMSNCRIRIVDSFRLIDSTYDIDMVGRDEASVYCMVYDDFGQNYAWAHEFTSRYSEMPSNFDGGVMDGDDMQNFWQEGTHSWRNSFGGRMMFTM